MLTLDGLALRMGKTHSYLVTLYDLYVQVAIGGLLLFCRKATDIAAHVLLLFFIVTTYLPAPVFGFGITLAIMGFAL